MRWILALASAVLALVHPADARFPDDFDSPLDVVAFGSCNRGDLPQVLWPAIRANRPDLWIWMGDNVYADTRKPEEMRETYDRMFHNPDYRAFREATPVLGTWDDHDYGENNAHRDYPMKREARDLAFRFWELPEDDPRWKREGVYGSYVFGPQGRRVKVLLIDGRYFSTEPDIEGADLLGPAQQQWLEAELAGSDAQVHLIVSGIQFLPGEHKYEKWSRYPDSRDAVLDMIREHAVPGVVFLSGDRHIHEISRLDDDSVGYPLYEITSSGMTHSWEDFPGEPNRLRVNEVYTGKGFGTIRFDWEASPATLTAEIRDADNRVVNTVVLALGS